MDARLTATANQERSAPRLPGARTSAVALVVALLAITPAVEALADGARRAILVGISRYDAGCPAGSPPSCRTNNLEGPRHDVDVLSSVLRTRFDFADDEIVMLVDSAATKDAFRRVLEQTVGWAKEGRHLFLYFSGHGTGPLNPDERLQLPDGSGALVMAPPSRRTGNWLTDLFFVGRTDLRPLLERIDANGASVFAIFDACYSRDTVRTTDLPERRFKSLETGLGLGFDPIDVSGLRAGNAGSNADWPYRNLIYFSAAAANEPALDLSGNILRWWPTFDGRPHGALTDALLRVMTGDTTFTDQDNDGVMSYADLFATVEEIMRRRQYPHSPHRQPHRMNADVVAAALARWPAFTATGAPPDAVTVAAGDVAIALPNLDLPAPPPFVPPIATDTAAVPTIEAGLLPAPAVVDLSVPTIRVQLPAAARALRERLAAIDGIELVDDSAEYRVEAVRDRFRVSTGHGDPLWRRASGEPELQFDTEVVASLARRAQIRRLAEAALQRSRDFVIESGPGEPDLGGTLVAGQPLTWAVRTTHPMTPVLLHVMGDGSAQLWLPHREGDRACQPRSVVPANEVVALCRFGGSQPPYGLDLLVLFGFEGDAPAVRSLRGGPVEASTLSALERLIQDHEGQVSADERSLFTVLRRGPAG